MSILSNLTPEDIEDFVRDDLDSFLSLTTTPLNAAYQKEDMDDSELSDKERLTTAEEVATPLFLNEFSGDQTEQLINTGVEKIETSNDHGASTIIKINIPLSQKEIASMLFGAVHEPDLLVEQNVRSNDDKNTDSDVLHLQEATTKDKALSSTTSRDQPMERKLTPDKDHRDFQFEGMAQKWSALGNNKTALQQNQIPSSQTRSVNGLHLTSINDNTAALADLQEPPNKSNDRSHHLYSKREIQPKLLESKALSADPILGKVTDTFQSQTGNVASMAQTWNAKCNEGNKKPKLLPPNERSTHHYGKGNRSPDLVTTLVEMADTNQSQLLEKSTSVAVANTSLLSTTQQTKLNAPHKHLSTIEDVECTLITSDDNCMTATMATEQVPNSSKIDISLTKSNITEITSNDKHFPFLSRQLEGTAIPESVSQMCVMISPGRLPMLPDSTPINQSDSSYVRENLQIQTVQPFVPTTNQEEDDLFSLDVSDEDISMFSFPTPAAKDGAAVIRSKPFTSIPNKQKASAQGSAAIQGSLFSNKAVDVTDELAEIQWSGPSVNTGTRNFPIFSAPMSGFSNAMKRGTYKSGRWNLKN